MQRIEQIIDRVEMALSIFLMGLIVLLVFTSSLLRYLGYPINGADTIATTLFVWVIYIGADMVLRRDRHLGVDYIVKKLPAKLQFITSFIALIIIFAFLLYVAYIGMTLTLANDGRLLGDLPVSYALITTAIPFGTILMCFTIVTKIVTLLRGAASSER